nr:hypothetical protein [Tanacetum cinerariifolium]
MMDERDVIKMKVDNEEGAKVMRKRGQYHSQRAVQVACNFKLEDLPLKINLLMGGYLTGRTANLSDSINTKDIAEVLKKAFLNDLDIRKS